MNTPLGILSNFQITSDQSRRLRFIEAFDFSDVNDTVVEKFEEVALEIGDAWLNQNSPMKPSQMKRFVGLAEKETKKFLSLRIIYAKDATRFVPSRLVDRFWHQLIIDTRAYHDFCSEAYGEYLHHEPARKRVVVDMGNMFAVTKSKLTDAYGPLPPLVWGHSAACDFQGCMSGCFD